MTDLSSQGLSAQTTTSPIEPERDSLLVQICARVFGARDPRVCYRPMPAMTPGLIERIRNVHASIEHARQHPEILKSHDLIEAAQSYNGVIGRYLEVLKSRDSQKFWRYQAILTQSPQSFEDHEKRLKVEFDLCSDSSGPHFFHFRNAAADLYDKAAVKAGLQPHP